MFLKHGDAAVIQAHGEDLVVLCCVTDDGIDGNEMAEDDGVVIQRGDVIDEGVAVGGVTITEFGPGFGHGDAEPLDALGHIHSLG